MLSFRDAPSPNFDKRRVPPDMLVLHYTGMRTADEAVARLRDPEAKVSAHYVVEEDGSILRLVAEDRRAWHAGRGAWQGETDCNAASIIVKDALLPVAESEVTEATIGDRQHRGADRRGADAPADHQRLAARLVLPGRHRLGGDEQVVQTRRAG